MEDQKNIIIRSCGDIAMRIKVCRSRSVAKMLKQRLCDELETNCKSDVVRQLLEQHVDQLISEVFDKQGRNKFLEES
jgi:hypothetical protein